MFSAAATGNDIQRKDLASLDSAFIKLPGLFLHTMR